MRLANDIKRLVAVLARLGRRRIAPAPFDLGVEEAADGVEIAAHHRLVAPTGQLDMILSHAAILSLRPARLQRPFTFAIASRR
jgi:hypothetical protein